MKQSTLHNNTQTEDGMTPTDIPAERPTSDAMTDELAHGDQSRPSVLFVCVHNAGRSQMAAGYLRQLSGCHRGPIGWQRTGRQDQPGCCSGDGRGRHRHRRKPKILTNDTVKASDVVITMGCGDTCPYYPGRRYEDWILDDPAGQGIEMVPIHPQ